MTHYGPVKDSEGTFGAWVLLAPLRKMGGHVVAYHCPRCRSAQATRSRTRDSNDGAYEDEEFYCLACGFRWWVDGIDS